MAPRPLPLIFALVCALILSAVPAAADGSLTVMCNPTGTGWDRVDRGMVVPNYMGSNVKWVHLWYQGDQDGSYEIRVTLRRGSFNGPQVGPVGIAFPTLKANTAQAVIIPFADAPVTPGDTLTLSHRWKGPAGSNLYFGADSSGCTIGTAWETEDTTPPLSSVRRNPTAIWVAQENLSGACIPADNVLCLDGSAPGDRRFRVRVNFSTTQGGGASGDGQAIPQTLLGVNQGGLFWFFDPANPEMLIKILNACYAPFNKFWVFYSAGTNVGFTITVTDTQTGQMRHYSNPDLNPAAPIQDVAAFDCP